MKKDFNLLLKVAVDQIDALCSIPLGRRRVARRNVQREFLELYKQELTKRAKKRKIKVRRVNSEDRCGW